MRVHELAKELGVSAKELMENAKDKLEIVFKSHSATVSQGNIDKIRGLYQKPVEKKAKPKAFIVKKAKVEKPAEDEVKEENKEQAALEHHPLSGGNLRRNGRGAGSDHPGYFAVGAGFIYPAAA